MKSYTIEIYIESEFTTVVKAKNKADARKKAINKLRKKSPVSFIKRHWPSNKMDISVDEC